MFPQTVESHVYIDTLFVPGPMYLPALSGSRDYTDEEILADSAFQQRLIAAPILALDLETTGLDPKADEIVLITLATPDEAFIFSPGQFEAIRPLLADPALQLLVHYAPFDLGFLYAKFGLEIEPPQVYDTRKAEKAIQTKRSKVFYSAAYQSASLGPTVKRYLGVDLDKGLATSFLSYKPGDPISEEQFEYAANDALALFPVALHQFLTLDHPAFDGLGGPEIHDMYRYVDGDISVRPDSR